VRGDLGMTLCAPSELGFEVRIGLAEGPMARRLHTARRTDPLPRAVGLARRRTFPNIVDATAGMGRDAFVLAHLGCPVIAIERVPALAFLLQLAAAESAGIELSVVTGDAVAWLRGRDQGERPDVVYLDPMFGEHGKAQVKKEMQACRALAPADACDERELLRAAREAALDRVVVKRAPGLAPIADDVSHAVPGERVRFDVYLA